MMSRHHFIPEGVRAHFNHARFSFSFQEGVWIGDVEEEELQVNWRRGILPARKDFFALCQSHLLHEHTPKNVMCESLRTTVRIIRVMRSHSLMIFSSHKLEIF